MFQLCVDIIVENLLILYLKGKTLLDYTNLFFPNDFKKNDQIINRIFKK